MQEVANDLKVDIKDVHRTFDIWIKFLDHIANNTDQATIVIPSLGQIYVSVHKMRRGLNTEKLKAIKERKLREIEKIREKCEFIVHEKSVPIILKYGVAKRNKREYIIKKLDKPKFYTPRFLINNQNNKFFEEDLEFSDQKHKLIKYFIDNTTDENN